MQRPITKLHDLNGDNEIDYIESFNNDHQVTEHFHEFAMGLQTDDKEISIMQNRQTCENCSCSSSGPLLK